MIRKDLIRHLFCMVLLAGVMTPSAAPLLAQTPPATNSVIAIGPSAQGIVQAGDGNFYAPSPKYFGACQSDSTMECAYIYRITPTGVMTPFYSFQPISTSSGPTAPNADGLWPVALIVGSDGYLYGACRYGGPGGFGTIFQIDPAGNIKLLKSFGKNPGTVNGIDLGDSPLSLVQGSDGSLYETNGVGVYQLAPDGSFNELFNFQTVATSGSLPSGGNATSLMQGIDGNLYLTLSTGPQTGPGTGSNGSIAQLNLTSDQLTTVHAFLDNGTEGSGPMGPLVQGSDGSFYGVTSNHPSTSLYAFKILPEGSLELLHNFTGGADGGMPQSPLILGSDGNLYGAAHLGGDTTSANCAPDGGCGVVYQLTPGGLQTILHTFEGGTPTSTVVSENPQFDGAVPEAPLVQANDGTFWGTSFFNAIFKTTLNSAPPAPVKITLKPTVVAAGNPTTVTWKVLNAFSKTAQVCGASIVGNATGAGTWTGLQPGTLTASVYTGSATITPTAGGTYTYAISCGGNESAQATLLVTRSTSLELAPPGPAMGAVSQKYQLVLDATGGTTPYAFGMTGTVPKGLVWSSSGTLFGSPLQFGDYSVGFGVQDSSKPPEQDSASITLHIVSGLTLLPLLQKPTVGKYYASTLITSGGLPPYTWKLASGTLPDGLQFNASGGTITGTPTKPGTFKFSITVNDSEGTPDKVTTAYTVNTSILPLDITQNAPLPPASVGMPYSYPMAATGGVPPYFWSILPSTSPTVINPPGLTISQDGIISGTPIQYSLGYDNFYIQVTDSDIPPSTAKDFAAIIVKRTLQITGPTSLPTVDVGQTVFVPLTATGGIPPYKWKGSSFPDPDVIGIYTEGDNLVLGPIVATTADVTIAVKDSEVTNDGAQVDLPLVYLPAPLVTMTTLTSSNTVAGTGESVTFNAKVTISSGGAPSGQVIFYNGTASLGTSTLDASGNATLQTSFAANGVYSITAAYGGNQSYAASTSSSLTETVVTPSVTAAAVPSTLTLQPGSSGQMVITVTPVGGYTGTVNFTCGMLPAHISCSFAPPSLTIAANGGPFTDTLTVSTNAPAVAMLLEPHKNGAGNIMLGAAMFWLPGGLTAVFGLLRRSRRRKLPRSLYLCIIAFVCLAGAMALNGCGGMSNNARPGTYNIPVTLTLAGGTTQSINATVVIE